MTATRDTAAAGAPQRTRQPGRDGGQDGQRRARGESLGRAIEQAPELADLIRLYFRHVPDDEIVADEPTDLAGIVRAHRELAANRVPRRPAIRVFNPSRGDNGWSCPATVGQVVTDDMNYLVDSVVAELARCEVTVYRVVHPIVVVRRSVTGDLQEALTHADPTNPPGDALSESWMYLEVSRIADGDAARNVEQRLN